MKIFNLNKKIFAILFLLIIMIFFGYYLFSVHQFIGDVKENKTSISNLKYKIDMNEFVFHHMDFIKLNKQMKEKINMNLFLSFDSGSSREIYITEDGSLINLQNKGKYNQYQLKQSMVGLKKYLENKNIQFLYLESPDKSYFYPNELNKYNYTIDYDSYKKFHQELKANNIDYIDTNEVVENMPIKNNEVFYKTDLHWTSETARQYATYLAEYINKKYQWNLDTNLIDSNQLSSITYPKQYEGYYARIANLGTDYHDDIIYYVPNYNVELEADYYNYFGKVSGDFKKVMYKNIDTIGEDYYNKQLMYQRYLYGVSPLKTIENKTTTNQNKILVIGDSQFWPVAPIMSLLVKNIDIIDIRSSEGNYTGKVREYIEKNNPDMVIYFTNIFDVNDLEKLQ